MTNGLVPSPLSSGIRPVNDVGVLLSEKNDTDNNGRRRNLAVTMLSDAPTEACIKVVSALVSRFGADNAFILSKCGAATQRGTVVWLNHYNFFAKTGLRPGNVVFCVNRTGIDGEDTDVKFSPVKPPSGERMRELCEATGRDEQELQGYFGAAKAKEASAVRPLLGGGCGKGIVAKKLRLTHFIDDRIECLHSLFFEGGLAPETAADFATVANRSALLHFGIDEELPAHAAQSLKGIAPSKQPANVGSVVATGGSMLATSGAVVAMAGVAVLATGGMAALASPAIVIGGSACAIGNVAQECSASSITANQRATWVGPFLEEVNPAVWKERSKVHRACADWDAVARCFALDSVADNVQEFQHESSETKKIK
jgi:hypothetical protein